MIDSTTGTPIQPDQQQRVAPADQQDQGRGHRRGGGEPDMADKGMQ
jgi:hypothetical protein